MITVAAAEAGAVGKQGRSQGGTEDATSTDAPTHKAFSPSSTPLGRKIRRLHIRRSRKNLQISAGGSNTRIAIPLPKISSFSFSWTRLRIGRYGRRAGKPRPRHRKARR